jgi:hypothetical protein
MRAVRPKRHFTLQTFFVEKWSVRRLTDRALSQRSLYSTVPPPERHKKVRGDGGDSQKLFRATARTRSLWNVAGRTAVQALSCARPACHIFAHA